MNPISKIFIFILFLLSFNSLYSQQYRWYTLPNAPFTYTRSEDIFFINEYTGWIVRSADSSAGQLPNIFKTTDGGESWINQFAPELGYPRCIGFANSSTGWIGTYYGDTTGIFKTTDGGDSWFNQLAAPRHDSIGICGIYVLDENTVRACGKYNRPAKFYKTDDGGANWVIKDMSSYATRLIDCYFTTPDSGFVVGGIGHPSASGKGIVLFTSDGGETWITRIITQNIGHWGWKIDFPTPDTGYVSLEKRGGNSFSYFLKTTDGGVTWKENIFTNFQADEEGIGFINNQTGWIGGWWFNTYETTNGGVSWHQNPWGYNFNRFRKINDTLAYAVGQTVYKYMRDSTVGISQISNEVPDRTELIQNYPNPFNPSTTIKFHVSDFEHTKLIIFDVLGREVSVLVNSVLNPGVYEYKFDATGLQSGVYFYKVETERYTETKKMILLK